MTITERIIQEFRLAGKGTPLEGGQSTSLIFGNVVVKPVEDPLYYDFASTIFYNLKPQGYRISKPIKSIQGDFVVDGYGASLYEPGAHDFLRIEDVLAVSDLLHHDLRQVKTTELPAFDNPWAHAHSVLWRSGSIPDHWHPETLALVRYL